MRRSWIPPLGGSAVAVILAVPAGLGDWSAPALYACVLVGIVAAGVLFALTDGDEPSNHP